MLEIFSDLRALLQNSPIHIDGWVFRLNYSLTSTCMFAFSILISASQYVGNPIDCIHTNDIPEVKPNNENILHIFILGSRQHLLLDTLHLHHSLCFLEEDWTRSCPSWGGQGTLHNM